jgi:hypothetical protein
MTSPNIDDVWKRVDRRLGIKDKVWGKLPWKQTAKYWYSGDGHEQVYELGYADGYSAANDDASGRLKLLTTIESNSPICPICGKVLLDMEHEVDEFETVFERGSHAPDCELGKELKNG